MAGSREKLLIVGDGETAELAYDYFTSSSKYEIVGFTVERKFLQKRRLFSLPVVAFESVENSFDPSSHKAYVAVSSTQLNRLRTRLYEEAKKKGYTLCSYISPNSFVGHTTVIGENCFIFENVAVQRGAQIGNNVTIWSGSVVGHRTRVGNNCFLSSHVAVSGFCEIGENCFLGVNSCTADAIKVGNDCIIGAGAVVINDTLAGSIYVGNPAKPLPNKRTDRFILGEETIDNLSTHR